jgi:hypothetical protein
VAHHGVRGEDRSGVNEDGGDTCGGDGQPENSASPPG